MAILQGTKDQLLSNCRSRTGELSMVDAEGVMADGSEEISDFYAGVVAQSVLAGSPHRLARDVLASHPPNSSTDLFVDLARFKPASHNRGTACLGAEIHQTQDDLCLAPLQESTGRATTGVVQRVDPAGTVVSAGICFGGRAWATEAAHEARHRQASEGRRLGRRGAAGGQRAPHGGPQDSAFAIDRWFVGSPEVPRHPAVQATRTVDWLVL